MINHLWIIMDWNRRWAKSKSLPSIMWHKAWADNVKNIARICEKKWIKYLTLWALSSDNLVKRPKEEIESIIKLINNIEFFLWEMLEKNTRFETIWNIEELPEESQIILNKIKEKTKNNSWLLITIWLVYWWQDEIIRATKKIISYWLSPDELSKEKFREFLDTSFLPNPDVIVRTWWDKRHSWFLLFDSEYSEYFFTEKKWPEFDENEINSVIEFYNSSKRNFWK